MEIEVKAKITCNVKEAIEIIREGPSASLRNQVMHLITQSLSERFDLGPDERTAEKVMAALDRVSLDAILLLAQIVSDESYLKHDVFVAEFDDIQSFNEFCEQDQKVVKRKIGSRIGGLRKITDSLEVPALATIERGFDGKVVEVKYWAKPIIEAFVRTHRTAWVSHLKKNGFDDHDPLNIVKS